LVTWLAGQENKFKRENWFFIYSFSFLDKINLLLVMSFQFFGVYNMPLRAFWKLKTCERLLARVLTGKLANQ